MSRCNENRKFGLSVNDDGVLVLRGEPFYGYGMNIYSAFQGLLYPEEPAGSIYKEDFAMMEESELPIARIPLSCWASQHLKMWMDDPVSYFEKMDKVVAEAEKTELGIIVSLMWRVEAVSENVGEPIKEMGNPKSKIIEVSKKYIGEVVSRYVNSPAIWMWEIGNEFNLPADLDAKYVGGIKNCCTTDDFAAYQRIMAEHIKTIDPFRAITTGNAMVRATAYHLMKNAHAAEDSSQCIWYMPEPTDYDTVAENEYMLKIQNPDPVNVCSIHMQHWRADGLAVEELGGKFVSYLDYLTTNIEAGKSVNKPVYFGEVGDMMQWHELGEHYMKDWELMKKNFYIVTDALVNSGLQLATAWLMGTVSGHVFTTVNEDGESHDMLFQIEEFARINKMFREQGKQKADEYWKWAKE